LLRGTYTEKQISLVNNAAARVLLVPRNLQQAFYFWTLILISRHRMAGEKFKMRAQKSNACCQFRETTKTA
jgi:hypothetical protein